MFNNISLTNRLGLFASKVRETVDSFMSSSKVPKDANAESSISNHESISSSKVPLKLETYENREIMPEKIAPCFESDGLLSCNVKDVHAERLSTAIYEFCVKDLSPTDNTESKADLTDNLNNFYLATLELVIILQNSSTKSTSNKGLYQQISDSEVEKITLKMIANVFTNCFPSIVEDTKDLVSKSLDDAIIMCPPQLYAVQHAFGKCDNKEIIHKYAESWAIICYTAKTDELPDEVICILDKIYKNNSYSVKKIEEIARDFKNARNKVFEGESQFYINFNSAEINSLSKQPEFHKYGGL